MPLAMHEQVLHHVRSLGYAVSVHALCGFVEMRAVELRRATVVANWLATRPRAPRSYNPADAMNRDRRATIAPPSLPAGRRRRRITA